MAKKKDYVELLKDKTPGIVLSTAGTAVGFAALKMIRDKQTTAGLGVIGETIGAVTSNSIGQYVPNIAVLVGAIIGSQTVQNEHVKNFLYGVAVAGVMEGATRAMNKNYFLGFGNVEGAEFGETPNDEFGYVEDEFGAIKRVKKLKSRPGKPSIKRAATVKSTAKAWQVPDLAGIPSVPSNSSV